VSCSKITMQCTSGQVAETSLTADINYNGQPSVLARISSSVSKVAYARALHIYVVQSHIKTNPTVCTSYRRLFTAPGYTTRWTSWISCHAQCGPRTTPPSPPPNIYFTLPSAKRISNKKLKV